MGARLVTRTQEKSDHAGSVKVTKSHGAGSVPDSKRLYMVEVGGILLRTKGGIGRRFESHEAAEKAGVKEWIRRGIQPRVPS